MAGVLQFEKKAKPAREKLSPALIEFIDEVIVPALVREYLAEKKVSNVLASRNSGVADSAAEVSA